MDSSMPATAHWDDAPHARLDVGPMGADWHLLGAAAGCDAVGLRRIRVSPGKQSTPLHAHFGEEELFYVLGGSGVSVQEDGAFAIAAGDVVLHPAGGPAHTVVGGDEGIDVLAFGTNLPSESVRFPRIGAAWIGGQVLDATGLHQFQLEAERAGPVEVPDQLGERPSTIVGVADVEPVRYERGQTRATARFLGRATGARRTALNLTEIEPGAMAAPLHCHSAIEELFVVLDGDGALLLGNGEEHPVRTGSLVCRPAGSGVAHAFRAGASGLSLLIFSDLHPNDMCLYPETGKVLLRGLGVVFRPEQVPFWED
jgi:uncharacterized cupin superfamily protein